MNLLTIKDKFKRGHQRFSDGTSMHGFTELYYAKTVFWKIIWFLLVFGAICLTIYMIIGAVQNFVYQTSNTLIQPITNDQLIYPPLKFCVAHWLYWINWEKVASLNFTKETALIGMSYLSNIYSSKQFNVNESAANFTEIMRQNNFTNMTEYYKAVAKSFDDIGYPDIFNETEFVIADLQNPYFCYKSSSATIKSYLQNPQNDYYETGNQKNRIELEWYSRAVSGVDHDEYDSYMAQWIYAKTTQYYLFEGDEIDYDYTKVQNNYSAVVPPNILFVDGFSNNNIKLSPSVDEYFITVKASTRQFKNSRKYKCKAGVISVQSDTTCLDYCSRLSESCYYDQTERDFVQATIEGLTTEHEKLIKKEILFLNETKLTTPVAFSNTMEPLNVEESDANNTAERNVSSPESFYDQPYTDRCNNTVMQRAYNDCIAVNCTNEGCEKWTFDITVTTTSLYDVVQKVAYKRSTVAKIQYPSSDDVLITTETDSKTWEDFIGNVGGLLGIWTGASILSFFQFFYLWCFADMQVGISLTRWWKRKRSREGNTNVAPDVRQPKQEKFYTINKKRPLKRIKTIIINPYSVIDEKDRIIGHSGLRNRNISTKIEK